MQRKEDVQYESGDWSLSQLGWIKTIFPKLIFKVHIKEGCVKPCSLEEAHK